MQSLFRVSVVSFMILCFFPSQVTGRGIQQSPYSSSTANGFRNDTPPIGAGLSASNPLGMPGSSSSGHGGSDNVSVSSALFQGILPKIPNLQLGYNYTFGPNIRAGTASIDYLAALSLGGDSTIYGEAHGELQSFSISNSGSSNNSVDVCLGGGYRRMLGKDTMIGFHSFFDTTRLSGSWYQSGSLGIEMAARLAGHDAIDVNSNWYGKALDAASLNNLGYPAVNGEDGFGNSNFDFQVGYSHELYAGGPDFRLSLTGYKFDMDSDVYGYYAGAELKSRNGMFVLKYDVGYDNTNEVYQSASAFMNVGFQLENLFSGDSPFMMPKPVFQSPREMTRLTEAKVNRNWRRTSQAAQIAMQSAPAAPCTNPATLCPTQTITVINQRTADVTLYMGFLVGETGGYNLATDFPGWNTTSNPLIITTTVAANNAAPYLVVTFPSKVRKKVSFVITADKIPWTSCSVTQGEWTLADNWCQWGGLQDTYDISLVNGFNLPMKITPVSGQEVIVTTLAPNNTNTGVYPFACTQCVSMASNAHCKGQPGAGSDCKSGPDESHPDYPCQLSQASVTNYNLTILP